MKQLARTLLILGSVTACERAHPEADPPPRPAVAKPAAAAPLIDMHGSPAVGNIGQTGAPEVVRTVQRPARRIQRVVRAATVPRAQIENPDPLQRPDLPPPVPPSRTTRLEFQVETQAGFALAQERPLVNQRERPAHANMGRRASIAENE